MLQKRNQDFTERYPNIKAGTYKPMRIRDILTENRFFCRTPEFQNTSKTHSNLKFGKEIKILKVVDTSLLPLTEMILCPPQRVWLLLIQGSSCHLSLCVRVISSQRSKRYQAGSRKSYRGRGNFINMSCQKFHEKACGEIFSLILRTFQNGKFWGEKEFCK